MMKKIITLILSTILFVGGVYGQAVICPSVNAQVSTGPSTTICQGNCATLSASVTPVRETTTYLVSQPAFAPQPTVGATNVVMSDDSQTGPLPIGFTFCFFGNSYTQFYLGSNGWISFSPGQSTAFTSASIPSGAINVPKNCIMGPWQDWHPGIAGGPYIRYQTIGTAPCRRLVVSWNNCPMFQCTTTYGTFQIVLYETTNIIDNNLINKPACLSWAGGTAVQGIHNLPGTVGITVPGRNSTQWTAVNQTWRYTPNGAQTYTVNWTGPTGPVGTGTQVTVCPMVSGTYTANATLGGCVNPIAVSHTVQVIVSPTPTISVNNPTICPGTQGTLTASGASTYTWQPGNIIGPTAVFSPTTTSTYTVVGTSTAGCTSSTVATITTNSPLSATINSGTIACFGGVASTTVNPVGGGGPYTYTWNSAPVQNTQVANLPAGSYTVTVNSMGCIATASVTITQPSSLTATGTQTNVTCFGGSNGAASVNPLGGTPPYTYLWSNAQTTQTATNLAAGNYTCTITDNNGCVNQVAFVITQPTQVTIAMSMTATTCGLPNGSAIAVPSGGVGPYTYLWSNGATTQTITNILSGLYTVTVTSVGGCTVTNNINVTNTGAPTVTIPTFTNVSCFGGNNGAANSNVVGGVGPFTYTWNSVPVQNTPNATNLPAGSYTLTVTGSNGCSATSTVTITQPTLTVTNSFTNVSCFGGNNGSATANPGGGTPPYSYLWSNGQTTQTAINLPIGNYTCTVTDNNGCQITTSVVITQPTLLTTTSSFTNVSCFGGNNGSAIVNPSGGTPPYTYLWSNAQTTQSVSNLVAGNYTCTITDNKGCHVIQTFVITQPTQLVVVMTMTGTTCGLPNGSASVTPSGGVGPYTYLWSNTQTTQFVTNILSGVYSCTVTDANGCQITGSINVTNTGAPVVTIPSSTNVSCFGGNNGSANSNVVGGVPPYTYSWSNGQTTPNATNLPVGTYTLTVTGANGCPASATVTITQPTQLTAAITTTNVSCFGGNNGSAIATPAGGVGPYTYLWTNTQTTQSATNLPLGVYTCTITDANGCQVTAAANITQPTLLTLAINSQTNISCFGGNNGSINVSASGGTGLYQYSLNNGPNQLSATFNTLTAGTYTVRVTDANGCIANSTITLTQPTALNALSTSTNVTCNGSCDGQISTTPSGGVAPYTYLWSNSSTANPATNLCSGTYSVVITDANGCKFNLTNLNITQPAVLSISTNPNPQTICIGQTSNISSNVLGGTAPYTYIWSNGPTTSNISVSPSVTTGYTVSVTDQNGCTATTNIIVNVNPPLSINATSNPTSICAGGTSTLSSMASGGNGGPYTFVWTPGGNGQIVSVSPSATTVYTVTLSDGCSSSVSATTSVIVNPVPTISLSASPLSGCAPLVVTYKNLTPGISNCIWNINGVSYNNCSVIQTYTTTGSFSANLTVTDVNGCSSISSNVVANVYPKPVASFSANPVSTDILSPSVIFTNMSTPGSYDWNFGDGVSSNIVSPTHLYSDTGSFVVQLTVLTSYGCSDIATMVIRVNEIFAVYVPNAFTVNSDGKNDTFYPVVTGAESYQYWIFDRWGENIFHSDSGKPWDGTYKGVSVKEDTYVWKLSVIDKNKRHHEYVGHVTLLR